MALAKAHDAQIGYAITPDILKDEGGLLSSRGKVIFHSTFENGTFDGWRDHQGGFSQNPCIGLTRYPVHSGSHALQLSTGETAYASGKVSNSCSAYKNLTMVRETGLVSYSGWFAHAGDANTSNTGDVAYYSWGLNLDIQKHLNGTNGAPTRRFFQLHIAQMNAGAYPSLVLMDPQSGTPAVVIASTGNGIIAGENEGKHNFNYIRLTVDLSANGGLGGPVEAQLNSRVYDLRSLGYTAAEPAQTGSAMADFAGGMNAGVGLTRSTLNQSYTHNVLTCDNLVLTQGDSL